jgi:mRNA interferase MazF
MANNVARTEVWMTDFGFGRGREQAGMRPSLIISHDGFNQSAAELVIVIPITSKAKGIRTHVKVKPPEGGLTMVSYVKCEDV